MNGTTLCTISAPGCFGVQAKRAIGLALRAGERVDEFAGRRRLPGRARADGQGAAARRCRRARCASMNFTDISTGAASSRSAGHAGHRADGRRRDHRRAAAEAADRGGARVRAACAAAGLLQGHGVLQACGAAAHIVEHGCTRGQGGAERADGVDVACADQRIDRPVGAVEDEDVVVVEISCAARGRRPGRSRRRRN